MFSLFGQALKPVLQDSPTLWLLAQELEGGVEYELQVRAGPRDHSLYKGTWSDWSTTSSLRTPPRREYYRPPGLAALPKESPLPQPTGISDPHTPLSLSLPLSHSPSLPFPSRSCVGAAAASPGLRLGCEPCGLPVQASEVSVWWWQRNPWGLGGRREKDSGSPCLGKGEQPPPSDTSCNQSGRKACLWAQFLCQDMPAGAGLAW